MASKNKSLNTPVFKDKSYDEHMNSKRQTSTPSELSFSERVLHLAVSIPKGKVTTYARLAVAAGGSSSQARFITSVLARANKSGKYKIPYHRIVYSDGRVWLDPEYAAERLALYKREGIILDNNYRIFNFEKILV